MTTKAFISTPTLNHFYQWRERQCRCPSTSQPLCANCRRLISESFWKFLPPGRKTSLYLSDLI